MINRVLYYKDIIYINVQCTLMYNDVEGSKRPINHNSQFWLKDKSPMQVQIYLSHEAQENLRKSVEHYKYTGRGHGQGLSAYLAALVAANPDPKQDYTDNRPPHMIAADLPRLSAGNLPLWFEDNVRMFSNPAYGIGSQVSLNEAYLTNLIQPTLVKVARLRGIKSATKSTPRSTAACVIELIATNVLVPRNPPPECTAQRKRNKSKSPAQKYKELMFY